MKRLKVAVGVIFNQVGDVLIGQRTVKDDYFQQWEFPGGKLEANESPEQALVRELNEELGITALAWQPLIDLRHQYPDREVQLFVYRVTEFAGIPQGKEQQAIKWVAPEQLSQINFLSGNKKIIEAVERVTQPQSD